MKGSLDSVSKHSLILRYFRNLFIIGIAAAATFTAALPLLAADAIEQDSVGYVYYIVKATTNADAYIKYFEEGDKLVGATGSAVDWYTYHNGIVCYSNYQPYCTYLITFSIEYDPQAYAGEYDNPPSLQAVNFSTDLPGYDDVTVSGVNSINYPYVVYVKGQYETNEENTIVSYTIAFSTALEQIDNLDWGNLYASFDFYSDKAQSFGGRRTLVDVSCQCVFDPSAEYFQYLSLNNFKAFNDDLKNKLGILADKESEIIGMGKEYYEQSRDLLGSAIDDTKSFLSPAARSAASVGTAVGVFRAAIYDPLIASLPSELVILFTVIPTLAFAAWFLGFGKGF